MESHLDELPTAQENLMTVGAIHARDVHALCDDVAAMIFPSAVTPPTEATISAVTAKMVALVSDIEARLRADEAGVTSGQPQTWSLLAKSGFLRERDLVDFVLARVAEDRLDSKIARSAKQLPAQLLDHADPDIADTAQMLLAADSLHRRARRFSYQALRPELLHQLCWRIVAALEVVHGNRNAIIVANAKALLSEYDEGRTAAVAARKLVHFLGSEEHSDLLDPNYAGLHLYVACLADVLAIDQDHVIHLIDNGSSAPLVILLRAVGQSAEQAMATIYQFKEFALTPRDIALFNSGYERLQLEEAFEEVQRWGQIRTQYLMFAPGPAA
jgi:hypothetical protein